MTDEIPFGFLANSTVDGLRSSNYKIRENATLELIDTIKITHIEDIKVEQFLDFLDVLLHDKNIAVVQNTHNTILTLINNLDQLSALYLHPLVMLAFSAFSDTRKIVWDFGSQLLNVLMDILSPTSVFTELSKVKKNQPSLVIIHLFGYLDDLLNYNRVSSSLFTQFTFVCNDYIKSTDNSVVKAVNHFLINLKINDHLAYLSIINAMDKESLDNLQNLSTNELNHSGGSVVQMNNQQKTLLMKSGKMLLKPPHLSAEKKLPVTLSLPSGRYNRNFGTPPPLSTHSINLSPLSSTRNAQEQGEIDNSSISGNTSPHIGNDESGTLLSSTDSRDVNESRNNANNVENHNLGKSLPRLSPQQYRKPITPVVVKSIFFNTSGCNSPTVRNNVTGTTDKEDLSIDDIKEEDIGNIPALPPLPEELKSVYSYDFDDVPVTSPSNIKFTKILSKPLSSSLPEKNVRAHSALHSKNSGLSADSKKETDDIIEDNTTRKDFDEKPITHNDDLEYSVYEFPNPNDTYRAPVRIVENNPADSFLFKPSTRTAFASTLPGKPVYTCIKRGKPSSQASSPSVNGSGNKQNITFKSRSASIQNQNDRIVKEKTANQFGEYNNKLHSEEWSDHNDAIIGLSQNIDTMHKYINQNIRDIINILVECGNSLRTALAKNALSLLLTIINDSRIDCTVVSESACAPLLSIVSSGRNFISAIAGDCFDALIDTMVPSKAATILINESNRKQDKSRIRIAMAMKRVVGKCSNNKELKEVVDKLSQDPNPDVRKHAKAALNEFTS